MQAKYQVGSDPAVRFVALLQAALSGGRAHVANPRGKPLTNRGGGVGLAGNDLFRDPAVSYRVAQEMAGAKRIPVSEQTVRQRLRQLGLFAWTPVGGWCRCVGHSRAAPDKSSI